MSHPKTHGMHGTRIYQVWAEMKNRCNNKNDSAYHNYGGRGIKVCDRWNIFINFWKDMKSDYKEGLTIDRINNNGNYEPSNCRWITRKEQNINKRMRKDSRFLTFSGKTKNLASWAKDLGIKRTTITQRLDYYGWSIEKALTINPKKYSYV